MMGLIILMMAQPLIVWMIIQVMMMVLAQNLDLHQMAMKNPQDPMTQQKRKTQQTKQERESKMKRKTTQERKSEMKPPKKAKMWMRTPITRFDTVNQ